VSYQLNGPIWLDATQKIIGGISGSPILADDGTAIGVVSCSGGLEQKEGGPNARLDSHLPAWLLRDIITKAVQTRLIEKKTNRRVRQ
jgi:hypothetical protein